MYNAIASDKAGVLNVREFGAKGDGIADDTAAIQKALDAAEKMGGTVVFLPTGNYLVKTHLIVPSNVTLEGIWRFVPSSDPQNKNGGAAYDKGTVLMAVENEGNPDAVPFIHLQGPNATLKGVSIYYPNQVDANPPKPYPWTISGDGSDLNVIDVLLVNPYQGIKFNHRAGRYNIRNLYGQPLLCGIYIDNCFDITRIENVHFWPYWIVQEARPVNTFMKQKGTAFMFGRTDWQYMLNCFSIWYHAGMHFVNRSKDGPGNVLLTQCGSDICEYALLIDETQGHAGLSFVNGQFYGKILVKEANVGPVKFTGCGFFGGTSGEPGTAGAIELNGQGHVSFDNCHFMTIDPRDKTDVYIHATNGGVTVTSCNFTDKNKKYVVLDKGLKTGIVIANRFAGKKNVLNNSTGNVEIDHNVSDE